MKGQNITKLIHIIKYHLSPTLALWLSRIVSVAKIVIPISKYVEIIVVILFLLMFIFNVHILSL